MYMESGVLYTRHFPKGPRKSFIQHMRSGLVSTPRPKCSSLCCDCFVRRGYLFPRARTGVGSTQEACRGLTWRRSCGHSWPSLNRRWKWNRAIWSPQAQARNGRCLTLITRLTGVVRYYLSLIKCSLLFSTLNVTFTNMTKGQISCSWCISKCQAYKSILGEFVPRNYILVLSTDLNRSRGLKWYVAVTTVLEDFTGAHTFCYGVFGIF